MCSESKPSPGAKVWVFDLSWVVTPTAFCLIFDFLYRRYVPAVEGADLNALAGQALLLVLIAGFVLVARKSAVGGWRRPAGLSWLWVAGPLWLAVVTPAAMAAESIAAAPEKLAVWAAVSLFVAVNEETLFRGFMLRGSLGTFRPLTAVMVSSLVFGLLHFVNLYEGGDPVFVGAQMVSAAGVGSIFAAMTLRSGSIWPAVVLHALVDVVGLAAVGGVSNALQSADLAPSLVISGLIFFAWGLFWSWRAVRADKVVR